MNQSTSGYVGRFAPSPSGPLHAGSLVTALASYLDARAHDGRWLIRIEDLDTPRCVPGAAESMLHDLATLGMQGDGPVLRQSQRHADYQAALAQLAAHVYPCSCSRREIADSQTHHNALDGALVYAGTCRHGAAAGKAALAWRVRVPDAADSAGDICFTDRWQGPLQQRLATEIGDFVLRRADGVWAYQLAVVVDDAAQGVTHVVRGADLLGSTARQIHLQRLLGVPTPCYLHVPLLCGADGSKLSKQNHASALDLQQPLQTLLAAARFLGLQLGPVSTLTGFWQQTVSAWRLRDAAVSSSWQR